MKNLIVVLDTNILVYKTWLLRTSLGAAFLYIIQRKNATIGLPEIVEKETIKHAVKNGLEANEEIEKSYSKIEKIIGKRDNYQLPTEEEYINSTKKRFEELEDIIVRFPFTFSHAKGALDRIMNETPPNEKKNQQFKDSAIWESLLEGLGENDVDFITGDKGFFQDKSPDQGLAENLKNEVKNKEGKFEIFYELEDFLITRTDEIPSLDKEKIARKINTLLIDKIKKDIEEARLERLSKYKIEPFLTENHKELVIKFLLDYKITLFDDFNNEYQGETSVEGVCLFNMEENKIYKVELDSIKLSTSEDCPVSDKKIGYLRSADRVGSRSKIPYELRRPLL